MGVIYEVGESDDRPYIAMEYVEGETLRDRIRKGPLAPHEALTIASQVEPSPWLSGAAGADVYLKLECWQRTRSFKARGALNAVATLAPEQRRRGLVTASAGNHGQGVALAARIFDAPCTQG